MRCNECNQDHPIRKRPGLLSSLLSWRPEHSCDPGGGVKELAFKRPQKNKISEDAVSWEESQQYWKQKEVARKAALEARLAAIPEIKNERCPFMELATEIRQHILSYVLDWEDVRCIETSRTEFKRWKSLSLNDLPFVFHHLPPVFGLNRQILCEAVSVLLRKPMVLGPSICAHGKAHPSLQTNNSIIHPTARLLSLHATVTGEKLALTPKLIIEVDSSYEVHWQTVHQIMRLWRDGLDFDFLFVYIRKAESFDYSITQFPGGLKEDLEDAAVDVMRMRKGQTFTMSSSSWRKLPWPWAYESGAGKPTLRSSLEYALLRPLDLSASLWKDEQLKLCAMMPQKRSNQLV